MTYYKHCRRRFTESPMSIKRLKMLLNLFFAVNFAISVANPFVCEPRSAKAKLCGGYCDLNGAPVTSIGTHCMHYALHNEDFMEQSCSSPLQPPFPDPSLNPLGLMTFPCTPFQSDTCASMCNDAFQLANYQCNIFNPNSSSAFLNCLCGIGA